MTSYLNPSGGVIGSRVLEPAQNQYPIPNNGFNTRGNVDPTNPQREALTKLLGDAMDMRYNDFSLGMYGSAPRTETSLPLVVQGRATTIETKIFMSLLTNTDPIRNLMTLKNEDCLQIFFMDENLIGGVVEETSEKGPANVLAIDSRLRAEKMKRYGLDTRGNLNALLPKENQERERTQRNINALLYAFQQFHAYMGWEKIVSVATNIMDALQRLRPPNIYKDTEEIMYERESIYKDVLFGALSTDPGALTKFMQLVSRLQLNPLYEATDGSKTPQYDYVIVPPGTLSKQSLLEAQGYHTIAGVPTPGGRASYTREIPDLMQDSETRLKVIQHQPRISISGPGGMRDGTLEMSDLSNRVGVCTYYPIPVVNESHEVNNGGNNVQTVNIARPAHIRITNFQQNTWQTIKITPQMLLAYKQYYGNNNGYSTPYDTFINDDGSLNNDQMENDNVCLCLVRPEMVVQMCGILYARTNGDSIGIQGFAYPFAAAKNDVGSEELKIKVRMYLGSAIKTPRNLLFFPDVLFEHKISGYKHKIFEPTNANDIFERAQGREANDLFLAFCEKDICMTTVFDDETFMACTSFNYYADQHERKDEIEQYIQTQHIEEEYKRPLDPALDKPLMMSYGTTQTMEANGWTTTISNNGRLKHVDNPETCSKLNGLSLADSMPQMSAMFKQIKMM